MSGRLRDEIRIRAEPCPDSPVLFTIPSNVLSQDAFDSHTDNIQDDTWKGDWIRLDFVIVNEQRNGPCGKKILTTWFFSNDCSTNSVYSSLSDDNDRSGWNSTPDSNDDDEEEEEEDSGFEDMETLEQHDGGQAKVFLRSPESVKVEIRDELPHQKASHTLLTPFQERLTCDSLMKEGRADGAGRNREGGADDVRCLEPWQSRVDQALEEKNVKVLLRVLAERAEESEAIRVFIELLRVLNEEGKEKDSSACFSTHRNAARIKNALKAAAEFELIRNCCFFNWVRQLLLLKVSFDHVDAKEECQRTKDNNIVLSGNEKSAKEHLGKGANRKERSEARSANERPSKKFDIVFDQIFELVSDGSKYVDVPMFHEFLNLLHPTETETEQFPIDEVERIMQPFKASTGPGACKDHKTAASTSAGAASAITTDDGDIFLDRQGFKLYYQQALRERTRGVLVELIGLGFDCDLERSTNSLFSP